MKPPREYQLDASDFEGSPPWLRKLLVQLNEWMRDVRNGLNGGLTVAENLAAQDFDITVTGGAEPFDIKTRFVSPRHVLVTRCTEHARGAAAVTAAVTAVDWEARSGGVVRLKAVAGLTGGTAYELRVLVIGG